MRPQKRLPMSVTEEEEKENGRSFLRRGQYLGEVSAICFLHLPPHVSSLPLLLAGAFVISPLLLHFPTPTYLLTGFLNSTTAPSVIRISNAAIAVHENFNWITIMSSFRFIRNGLADHRIRHRHSEHNKMFSSF